MAIYVLVTGSKGFRGYSTFATKMEKALVRIRAHYKEDKVVILSYGEGRIPEYVRRFCAIRDIGMIIGNQEEGILAYHRLKEAKNWVNVIFDQEPMFPVKQILNAPTFKFRSQEVGG